MTTKNQEQTAPAQQPTAPIVYQERITFPDGHVAVIESSVPFAEAATALERAARKAWLAARGGGGHQ